MKHIGIVACSAEGAAYCYRELCREAARVVGEHDHPRVTMDSIPLARWMPSFTVADYRSVADYMLDSARVLAEAGADFAVCPDNSAHLAWDHVQARTPLPWLHIVDVVADEAARNGYGRVGILGTVFTMDGPVYPAKFAERGMEAVAPPQADREVIDRIIVEELVPGQYSEESRATFLAIIDRLAASGCDAVALACTEIPILVPPGIASVPTLDSTRLLASAALTAALDD